MSPFIPIKPTSWQQNNRHESSAPSSSKPAHQPQIPTYQPPAIVHHKPILPTQPSLPTLVHQPSLPSFKPIQPNVVKQPPLSPTISRDPYWYYADMPTTTKTHFNPIVGSQSHRDNKVHGSRSSAPALVTITTSWLFTLIICLTLLSNHLRMW